MDDWNQHPIQDWGIVVIVQRSVQFWFVNYIEELPHSGAPLWLLLKSRLSQILHLRVCLNWKSFGLSKTFLIMQISHSYEKLWPFEVTRLQNFGKSDLCFVVRLVIQDSGCNCSYTSLTWNVILKMLVSDSTILGAYNLYKRTTVSPFSDF